MDFEYYSLKQWLCYTHYNVDLSRLDIVHPSPIGPVMSPSLRLLTIAVGRHGILFPPSNLHQYRPQNLGHNRDGGRAHVAPDLDAHGAQRCPREREHPFDVVGEPAGWEGEHRGFRVPKL